MKISTKMIVISAMFASLVCVATMIIKIPTFLGGYINLGDGLVLLSGWMLPLPYGLLAAGIGSALADIFSGYIIYAPVTFIIKSLMAVLAWALFNLFSKKLSRTISRILSGTFSEVLMIGGYFLFEGIIYSFASALINIPANAIQGLAGLVISILLIKVLKSKRIG